MIRARGVVLAVPAALLALVLAAANRPDQPPLPAGTVADAVVVHKRARMLVLMQDGRPVKLYPVALGGAPTGPKRREGDERTPEGAYVIDARNPRSAFHRALRVSYPDAADRARAAAASEDPGGMIMVHGMRNGLGWIGRLHRRVDWTDGCIAVTNREMDELWRAVPTGTPIVIRP